MENRHEATRPGDFILDRYAASLSPEEREEAREQLRRFVRWQMQIIARQLREEQADSRDVEDQDTLDAANPLS